MDSNQPKGTRPRIFFATDETTGAGSSGGGQGPSELPGSTHGPSSDAGNTITIGDLLNQTRRAFGSHLLKFIALVVVVMAPLFVLTSIFVFPQLEEMQSDGPAMPPLSAFILMLAQISLTALAHAAVIAATIRHMRGLPSPVGQALKNAIQPGASVVVAAILIGIVLALTMFVCLLIGLVLPVPSVLGALLGVVLCCVLVSSFFVTIPAVVVEQSGPLSAMSRSASLTQGHRWPIFVSAFVIFFGMFVISFLLMLGLGAILVIGGPESMVLLPLVQAALQFGMLIITTILWGVLTAVVYARLRDMREGTDINQLAAVFQ